MNTRPAQRPASTSDARKRHAEAREAARAAFEANRRERCACGTHQLVDGQPVVTGGLVHDMVCISAEAVGL